MRSRAAFLVLLAAIGGAIALDETAPSSPRVPRGLSVPTAGGVLACPMAVVERGAAYAHLANVGDAPSRVRLTLIPRRGKPVVQTVRLEPQGVQTFRLHDRVRTSAAAVVEYAGGEVVAAHQLTVPGPGGGYAEAPCLRAAGDVVAVSSLSTLNVESTLALFNPGRADAVVSVAFLVEGRTIRPQGLRRRVVHARTRLDFDVGDFAFDAPQITAIVSALSGRVFAEGFLEGRGGMELLSGQDPALTSVAIAGASGKGTVSTVAPVGAADTSLRTRVVGTESQGSGGVPAILPAGELLRFGIPDRSGPAAYVFEVQDGAPVVAGASWRARTRAGQDLLATPAVSPATTWGGVLGVGGDGATTRALLVNPGDSDARVSVRIINRSGTTRTELMIPPGRLQTVGLGARAGIVAIGVISSVPIAVAMDSIGVVRRGTLYAYGVAATPLRLPRPVAAVVDPRVAVPAALSAR